MIDFFADKKIKERTTGLFAKMSYPSKIRLLLLRKWKHYPSIYKIQSWCEEINSKKVSTVLLDWTYIRINLDCTNDRRVSVRTHELKHVLFDRKNGSSTQVFQDTYFYSLYNSKAEQWANTFDTELLLANDAILKPIDYYEYARSFCKSSSTLSPIWLHWMRLPNCNVTKSKI